MNKSNNSTSFNEVFTPEHKLKHKRRNQNKKSPVWHPRKQPHSPTSPAQSNSQPTRKHSTEFSPDTSATKRSSQRPQNHSTSGYWELSSTGSRKSKNQSLIGNSDSASSMSFVSAAAIGFAFGFGLLLLGYWFGHNARGVEELGRKHGGVQYILPQNSPSSVSPQRVSI